MSGVAAYQLEYVSRVDGRTKTEWYATPQACYHIAEVMKLNHFSVEAV